MPLEPEEDAVEQAAAADARDDRARPLARADDLVDEGRVAVPDIGSYGGMYSAVGSAATSSRASSSAAFQFSPCT